MKTIKENIQDCRIRYVRPLLAPKPVSCAKKLEITKVPDRACTTQNLPLFFPVKMIQNCRIRYLRPLCCPCVSLIFTRLSNNQARESRSSRQLNGDIRNYQIRESRDRETKTGRIKRHPSKYPNPILSSFYFCISLSPSFLSASSPTFSPSP